MASACSTEPCRFGPIARRRPASRAAGPIRPRRRQRGRFGRAISRHFRFRPDQSHAWLDSSVDRVITPQSGPYVFRADEVAEGSHPDQLDRRRRPNARLPTCLRRLGNRHVRVNGIVIELCAPASKSGVTSGRVARSWAGWCPGNGPPTRANRRRPHHQSGEARAAGVQIRGRHPISCRRPWPAACVSDASRSIPWNGRSPSPHRARRRQRGGRSAGVRCRSVGIGPPRTSANWLPAERRTRARPPDRRLGRWPGKSM